MFPDGGPTVTKQNFPAVQGVEPAIVISTNDHDRLLRLARAAVGRYPADDAQLLLAELRRADVVPPAVLPAKVIAMNSHVEFRDDRTGKTRRVQLVYPFQADSNERRISVLSLIGAALIGLKEGQSITWQTRDKGQRGLTALRVSREPFADGRGPSRVRGEVSVRRSRKDSLQM